nr:putative ribonuclease H-like domain-containing protein [Tanacetum cinerariifolium]
MDLFGPISVSSISHKWYCLVVTDDFSRFTWTFFLKTKDETSGILRKFITKIENLKDLKVKIIRCDNGGEFRNKEMNDFCSQKGIKREFSNARTPQQNGVAERRNRILIEAARTMLADAKFPITFWAEAVNTSCYVQNGVLVNKSQNKTPYKLFNGRTPAIRFLKPFGCHVMIFNTLDNLGKFKAKGDEGYFIGYSMSSKAFRVFNKRTRRVEENLHVEFLENKAIEKGVGPNWFFDIDSLTKSMNYVPVDAGTNSSNLSGIKDATSQEVKKDVSSLRYIALPTWVHDAFLESSSSKPQDDYSTDVPESSRNCNPTATSTNPSADQIETLTVETPIPTVSSPVITACFTDSQDPSSDTRLISKRVANQVETPSLDNILTLTNRFEDILVVTTNLVDSDGVEADNVWTLVDCPKGVRPIGTKWVLKNKKDERGIVIRNKARLVAQGHTQEEGINYNEVFTPVARIKTIRLFLAYASFMGFTVYQMDVKSAFLYGTIDEEGGTIDQTLFIRRQRGDFILVQVYVDDIIFGSSNPQLCREFKALMHEKFQMSAMGELNFFLGLQVLQKEDGIFLTQDKYQVTPKECHLHAVKRIFRYLKGHPKLGLWYPKESLTWLSMPCEALSREISSSILCFNKIMARLQFCDYHNMVSILEKSEHNVDFHLIVDFVEASPLRIETTEEGTKILATVDGILRTVTESSLRRNLKLQYEEGLSSLPDAELFENLTLMGYNISPNQKIVPFFDTMLVPQGEGSGTPTEPHHTPSFEVQQTSSTTPSSPTLPSVTTAPILTVTLSDTPTLRQYTRGARIAHTTGTSSAADEGSIQLKLDELMGLCTSLQRQHSEMVAKFEAHELEINRLKARVKLLEDREGVAAERSRDDAPIKMRQQLRDESVPTVGPPATEVPTGSDVVPTVGPIFATTTVIDAQVARELEEQMAREDQRMTEQVARDAKIAIIHAEEELQIMIDGLDKNNEILAKYLQEYHQFALELPLERRIELISDLVRYQDNYAKTSESVPEEVKSPDEVPKEKVKEMMQLVPIEEVYVEALQVKHPIDWKHLDSEDLNQLWALVKESLSNRPPTSDKEIELWVELKRLYEPDDEDQLWTHTQNLMHAPVEWKLYDTCGVHHVTSKDKEIFMLVEKDYPLRKGLAIGMIRYKLRVKNYSKMANDLILKIYKIASSPRQQ